jgi:hypothetical protein
MEVSGQFHAPDILPPVSIGWICHRTNRFPKNYMNLVSPLMEYYTEKS